MKVNRSIIIEESEISSLFEDINGMLDAELTGVDPKSEEGLNFKKKYPALSNLHHLLESEVMKDQSTYNYERIKG
jgi:hypothetical protein